MPFITEALWQQVPHVGDSIMIAAWPEAAERDLEAEAAFGALIEVVRGIRNARAESGVEPARWIEAVVYPGRHADAFESMRGQLGFLGRIADDQLRIERGEAQPLAQALTVLAGDVVAMLPLAGMVDPAVERDRLQRELAEAEAEQERARKQLGNESFLARAPEHVVQVQRDRLARATEQIAVLKARLADLD
jgi:valyl-tRNA synthetase